MKIKTRTAGSARIVGIMIAALEDADIEDGMLQPSCITCEHFNEAAELCTKYNARPPARVIVFACDAYEDNNPIPF